MTDMRKVLQSILLIGLMGCNSQCEEPVPLDPLDQLPPITQTGENTFGCLINGEAFVVLSTNHITAIYQAGILQFGAGVDVSSHDESIIIWLEHNIEATSYIINDSVTNIGFFKNYLTNCNYQTYDPSSGSVLISMIDQVNFIVSGTFKFDAISIDCQDTIHITDGRFDLQYIP